VATRAQLSVGGPAYLEDCHPAVVVSRITDGLHGVVPHALDAGVAERLWEVSEGLVA
jgi:hypothetical protein